MSDLAPQLSRCRALRELGAHEIASLARLVEPRDVPAGTALFREGDEADELLVIAAGSVRLERAREPQGVLAAGELLGGASLVSVGRRGCDALAEEDVRVLALSRGAYVQLRSDHPEAALALHEGLLRELATQVRALVESQGSARAPLAGEPA